METSTPNVFNRDDHKSIEDSIRQRAGKHQQANTAWLAQRCQMPEAQPRSGSHASADSMHSAASSSGAHSRASAVARPPIHPDESPSSSPTNSAVPSQTHLQRLSSGVLDFDWRDVFRIATVGTMAVLYMILVLLWRNLQFFMDMVVPPAPKSTTQVCCTCGKVRKTTSAKPRELYDSAAQSPPSSPPASASVMGTLRRTNGSSSAQSSPKPALHGRPLAAAHPPMHPSPAPPGTPPAMPPAAPSATDLPRHGSFNFAPLKKAPSSGSHSRKFTASGKLLPPTPPAITAKQTDPHRSQSMVDPELHKLDAEDHITPLGPDQATSSKKITRSKSLPIARKSSWTPPKMAIRSPFEVVAAEQFGEAQLLDLPTKPVARVGSEGLLAHLMRGSMEKALQGGQAAWRMPWELAASDIEICLNKAGEEIRLGAGGFGEVLLARLRGVSMVAVKRLKQEHSTGVDRADFLREIALLKELANSNIVQFQGVCLTSSSLLLVTEHMQGGDLYRAVSQGKINWAHRGLNIAMDVISGLHYLHSKKIVHMDLKSPNILLTAHGQAKLADVGLAKVLNDRNTHTVKNQIEGTMAWAAPELLMGGSCTSKADMFSFGVVLWEIVTGSHPQRGRMRDVKVPDECPQEVAEMIDRCMEFEPAKRPNTKQVFMKLQMLRIRARDKRAEERRVNQRMQDHLSDSI